MRRCWMKKTLLIILYLALLLCLFGCDNDETPAGGGDSKITGSIAYFYGNEEAAIKTFNSEDSQAKEIELSKGNSYTIGLRPSFIGSKSAEYEGDCATFSFADNCCEINYIGKHNNHPVYELVIKTDSDFDLTITVDDYSQTIKIII